MPALFALPSVAHTLKPANSINWKMIKEEEGDTRVMYVPIKPKADKATHAKLSQLEKGDAANYKILGNSGVSVGAGVDLGQQNLDKVLAKVADAQLRASLKEKLQPFMGGRKDDAVRRMRDAETRAISHLQQTDPERMSAHFGIGYGDTVVSAGPVPRKVMNKGNGELTGRVLAPGWFGESAMTLSDAEANALTRAVSALLAEDLSSAFNARAKDHKLQFGVFPWQAQTVMMSLRYHTGSKPGSGHSTHKTYAAFWKAMTRGDLKEAVRCFEEDIVKSSPADYVNRRKKELKLLKEAAAVWKLQPAEEKDSKAKGSTKAAAGPAKPATGSPKPGAAPSLKLP